MLTDQTRIINRTPYWCIVKWQRLWAEGWLTLQSPLLTIRCKPPCLSRQHYLLLCVFYGSQIIHPIMPYTALTSWFLAENKSLMSVWPCIVDDIKRVKPTQCYTMVYWTLWIAQHVSGITMPIVSSLRLYRWSQLMAPHLGYGRLLVWCMAVGFWSVRLEGCFKSRETSL